ncbi:hypothetical protein, partial [Klebsiella pneumoniae]|uniref:hypothetical protein n=1 Tax=Klebsiella pneumoniae TaxID=573 RepID=UPI00272F3FEF
IKILKSLTKIKYLLFNQTILFIPFISFYFSILKKKQLYTKIINIPKQKNKKKQKKQKKQLNQIKNILS